MLIIDWMLRVPADQGCEVSHRCIECPLDACRYDIGGSRILRQSKQDKLAQGQMQQVKAPGNLMHGPVYDRRNIK